MGDISPVLEAFLRGQQQQTSIINQAHDIANQVAERKQRQQQIDDIISQHAIENTHAQKMYELSRDKDALEHQQGIWTAQKIVEQGLKSGEIPIPSGTIQGGMQIPGLTSPAGAGGSDAPMLPQQATSPPMNIPGMPQTVQSPTYSTNTPFGNITVPTPATTTTQDKINEYKATTGDTQAQLREFKNYQLEVQSGIKDAALAQQKQHYDDTIAELTRMHDLTGAFKEQVAAAKADKDNAARYNFMTPEQYQQETQNNATGVATGQMSWAQVDPKQKPVVREILNSRKLTDLPVKTADDIMGSAGAALRFIKIAPALKAVAGNDSNSAVAGNVVRNLVSKTPFYDNPKVSQFNSLIQPLLPDIEKAQGLSLARAGSSPQLANQQKNIMPKITDTADVIDSKVRNAADVHLSDLANKMANLTPEHRQLMWNRILTEYPELKEAPKVIYDKVKAAVKTGKYSPGGIQ